MCDPLKKSTYFGNGMVLIWTLLNVDLEYKNN